MEVSSTFLQVLRIWLCLVITHFFFKVSVSSITQVSSVPHIPVGKRQRSMEEVTNGYVPTDLALLNCHSLKQRRVTRNEMQGVQTKRMEK